MLVKKCARCQQEKSISEFYQSKQAKTGYTSYCKQCCCTIQKHRRNPDKVNFPPRHIKTFKICPLCNKEKSLNEFSPRKRKETKDGVSAYCRTCNKNLRKKRYAQNPEYFREYTRNLRRSGVCKPSKKHPTKARIDFHNCRAKKLNIQGRITAEEWENLKLRYNYTCLCCHRKEPEINLVFDHVIPVSKGGLNLIENIQPICFSCNAKKHTKIIDYRI